MMSFRISLRCVRWSNVVGECQRGRSNDVIMTVILEPKLLVDSIIVRTGIQAISLDKLFFWLRFVITPVLDEILKWFFLQKVFH